MRTVDALTDPDHMVAVIKSLMEKLHIHQWLGADCEVRVERITDVRDWNGWFRHLGISLEGGLLSEATGIHAFIFLRRKGLREH